MAPVVDSSPAKPGVLYGIGVGPGEPELMTLKGARVLERCRHIFVPKARSEDASIALSIAGRFLRADSSVCQLVFPMSADKGDCPGAGRRRPKASPMCSAWEKMRAF